MIRIGKKDRIFVAVLLPVLAMAGFVHCVRRPAMEKSREMKERLFALPEPSAFPLAERRLKEKTEIAKAELEKTKAEKPLAPEVLAWENPSVASRRESVLNVLRAKGANVKSVKPVDGTGISAMALKDTGCNLSPCAVRVLLEAGYPSIVESLKEIEEKKMAAIAESAEMPAAGKWEILLWF
jgi:hypothetical protein